MSLELLFSSYSVNWLHNVYYSRPGFDDTHRSTRGIRINQRLIIFPAHSSPFTIHVNTHG